MHLALHGVLACTFLLAGAQPASASLHRRRDPIQCCHTRASGATRCRVKTPRACRRYGGIDTSDAGGSVLPARGSEGSGDGQCGPNCPPGVATDGSGNVYVSDPDNNRIQKFDASGAFLTAWGNYGAGEGQFAFPSGVAADGSGDVYVADAGNQRNQKVDTSGPFLAAWRRRGAG